MNLVEGRAGDGVGKPEGGMAPVELSATGTGEVRYEIGMTRCRLTRAATAAEIAADADRSMMGTI